MAAYYLTIIILWVVCLCETLGFLARQSTLLSRDPCHFPQRHVLEDNTTSLYSTSAIYANVLKCVYSCFSVFSHFCDKKHRKS